MAARELIDLAARVADLERRAAGMMRHGRVAEIDPSRQRMRLDFGPAHGTGGRFLSPWVPYAQVAGDLKIHTPPSEGQQFTVISPGGDFQQAVAVPLTWSDDNPAPSQAGDENVLTYGNISATLKDDLVEVTVGGAVLRLSSGQIEIAVGDVRIKVADANVQISGGTVTHDGRDIGATHIHGGVQSGPALTDVPAT